MSLDRWQVLCNVRSSITKSSPSNNVYGHWSRLKGRFGGQSTSRYRRASRFVRFRSHRRLPLAGSSSDHTRTLCSLAPRCDATPHLPLAAGDCHRWSYSETNPRTASSGVLYRQLIDLGGSQSSIYSGQARSRLDSEVQPIALRPSELR